MRLTKVSPVLVPVALIGVNGVRFLHHIFIGVPFFCVFFFFIFLLALLDPQNGGLKAQEKKKRQEVLVH